MAVESGVSTRRPIGLEACAALGEGWVTGPEIYRNHRTRITQLYNTQSGQRLAMKQYLSPKNSATSEYAVLEVLAKRTNTAGHHIVSRPMTVLSEENAYCMEWLEGPSLWQVYRASPEDRERGHRLLGTWLAEFHTRASGLTGKEAETRCDAVRRLNVLTAQIKEREVPSDVEPLLRQALDTLQARATGAEGRREGLVLSPADPNPKNFILHQGRLTAIDVQSKRPRARHSALAGTLLRQLVHAPRGRRLDPINSPEARAFMAGYRDHVLDPAIWSFEILFSSTRFCLSRFGTERRPFWRQAVEVLAVQLPAHDQRHGRPRSLRDPRSRLDRERRSLSQ